MIDFNSMFSKFNDLKIAVVGDIMLDTYMWGHVERISPEAPVPIVTLDKTEYRIGGAGNVALNCTALGAQVSMFSVIGEDEDADKLLRLLTKNKIETATVLQSSNRSTTNKIRVISRNQQMMRLDHETTSDLLAIDEERLLTRLLEFIVVEKPTVLIFEDYNKGVLTEKVITAAIESCKTHGIVTAVDPKRKNFFTYKGVDIFKPNLKEVKEGLNLLTDDVDTKSLNDIHAALHEILAHKISLITLSEKGVYWQRENDYEIIPSHVRTIADVSGAGDTVIAVAAMTYGVTKDSALMAAMANIAGGVVCEEVGTAAISKKRLQEECELLLN